MEYPFLMQTHKRQDVANGGMARTTREGGGVTMQASPGIQW